MTPHTHPTRAARRAARAVLAVLAATLLVAPALSAQANRFTETDIFDLEFVADPQISPDGSQIVYVRQFSDIMKDMRYSNLWIIDADGSDHRPLTTGEYNDGSPRWSPDGKRLAFVSDRTGSAQIHVRWMDSGETIAATSVQRSPGSPSWSPDGEWLAFNMFVPGSPPRIAEPLQAPGGAEWAAPPKVTDRLVYRFDGMGDLEAGYSQVFVAPASGGTARQLTTGDYNHGGFAYAQSAPQWAPDGRSLFIAANRRPDWELEPLDSEVYEVDVATGALTQVTDRRGPDGSVAVSPDGRRIAYVGFDDRYQGYQVAALYVAGRDGSSPRVLTPDLDRTVASPTWSADGRGVYFMYDDEGNSKLGWVPADGGQVRVLAGDIGTGGSGYGGGSYSVANDGRFAISLSTPEIPGDLAVGTTRGGEPRRITAVNDDVLAHKQLGEVEEIWYESSKDGRRVQGWIVRPPDFDPSKKYPLILEIHGGPFANYGDRFDIEKQVMAAHGYVVLYTNPRGSTSYGEEFGNLIHHAYPGDDFYDLESGVDAVIAKGYVDPNRLYVTGGSGGGVLSTWVIGRTQRYKAAVVFYPVIDWYSFATTSDIPIVVTKYWFPGPPWEHPEQYIERSTISLVGNVTTPTMLMTGEEDFRTPMSETEQYYQALKLRGIESVLVRMPGEAHGIWGRPSHFATKLRMAVGWFDRHNPGRPTASR